MRSSTIDHRVRLRSRAAYVNTVAGYTSDMRFRATRVHSALWLVPLLCVLGGGVLSIVTVAIDRRYDHALVSRSLTGGPSSVQTILSTIATSTITLGSLVLTVTTVAVQLAMGQF